ncbi:MAG: zinc ribbon domain-containing protein, partial [Anaerolineae bacterium]
MTIDLQLILQLFLAVLGFYFLAFWVSLVVWTYRDIGARTQDVFVQTLGVAMVLFFNIPGLFLYYILRPRETLAEAFDRSLEEETLLRDLEERDDCPVCQHPIRADYQFCPNCQT